MADGMPGMSWKEALKNLKAFLANPLDGSPGPMQKELEGLEESLKGWELRDERRERSLEIYRQEVASRNAYATFTERTRKVMSLARRESESMNSGYISQEHILLGILIEGGSISARILKDVYSVDLEEMRTQLADMMKAQNRQV